MNNKINVSIVRYNQPDLELIGVINAILKSNLVNTIFIIDNSPVKSHSFSGENIIYHFNNKNLGYGKAHNIAIRQSIANNVPYHIVLNSDIIILENTISRLLDFMESNEDIGLAMPKIVYEDGSIQYLCKMLSTPFDLLGRRFLVGPLAKLYSKRLYKYELRHKDYESQMDVPNLSGCFMFIRTAILKSSGLFDDRFFMYLEDIDLTRRINQYSRTVYFPEAKVIHSYAKGSYKNPKLLFYHIRSAIKYFNKWGWIFDANRKNINIKLK